MLGCPPPCRERNIFRSQREEFTPPPEEFLHNFEVDSFYSLNTNVWIPPPSNYQTWLTQQVWLMHVMVTKNNEKLLYSSKYVISVKYQPPVINFIPFLKGFFYFDKNDKVQAMLPASAWSQVTRAVCYLGNFILIRLYQCRVDLLFYVICLFFSFGNSSDWTKFRISSLNCRIGFVNVVFEHASLRFSGVDSFSGVSLQLSCSSFLAL